MKKVTLIDYGAGNLHSVQNALHHIGCETVVADRPEMITCADRIILPGVGSFGAACDNLSAGGFTDEIKNFIASQRPFLGICLGLQLLFESSEESPGKNGLSVFKGKIRRFSDDMGLKVPHIGWNSLNIMKKDGVFKGIDDDTFVYFVHSYYLSLEDSSLCAAKCEYGITFDAAVQNGYAAAMQFHPEKSGEAGLKMLKNFIEL